MQKAIITILLIAFSFLSIILIYNVVRSDVPVINNSNETQPDRDIDKSFIDFSNEVLGYIKNKDYIKLSEHVHSEKGVRFSPYTYVNTERDRVLTQEEVKNLSTNTTSYLWGNFDGTGDEINLTFSGYYDAFVYNADFANAHEIRFNNLLSISNTINNIRTVYPNANVVTYYFSGFNPEYGGMDWEALNLIFEQFEGKWHLVGVVHDQWTI